MKPGGSFKRNADTGVDSLRRRRRRRRRESFASTCLDPALRAALGQRTVREDAELATRIVRG